MEIPLHHSVTGSARLSGVLGFPIDHSLSPRLHNYWLARLRVDGLYIPISVRPENLESMLKTLLNIGFSGINVTIPYKETMFSLCDETDELAKCLKAVNTLCFSSNRVWGTSTDGTAFIENFKQKTGLSTIPERVILVGSGGSSASIIASLLEEPLSMLTLFNRSRVRAELLLERFSPLSHSVELHIGDIADLPYALSDSDLLISTIPAEAWNWDISALRRESFVADISYSPLMTPLLRAARSQGNEIVTGIGMLIRQAVPGFRMWHGVSPPVDEAVEKFMVL